MRSGQYVVLGMARPQAPWFTDVARWANSGALPVDFLMVLSMEELCARLRSGRVFSALMIDAGLPGCDRDLFDLARGAGCAVVVVDDGPTRRSWVELGAGLVLPGAPGRDEVLAALREVARPVQRADEAELRVAPAEPAGARPSWRAPLVVVTGSGGTGRSTLAMAVATGLGADPRDHGAVVLVDGALRAQQNLLHDAGDVVPGLSELVDAHRSDDLDPDQVRQICFQVGAAGYDLLLGLRRQRDWAALRPRALGAALEGLRRSYRAVVAEVDADVEGESECGSVDVEERNLLARTCLLAADVVLAVGVPGVGGLHSLVRVLADLRELGVEPGRVVPTVNRAPRNPRARAEVSRALGLLTEGVLHGADLASTPLFVPERRRLDDLVRDGADLPPAMTVPLGSAVRAVLDRVAALAALPPAGPVAVPPGSLGSWASYPTESTG